MIFYAVRADDLVHWLENEQIRQAMMQFLDPDQVDVDPSFTTLFDDDFKVGAGGVTKKTFSFVYGSWIMLCNSKRNPVKLLIEHLLIYFSASFVFLAFIIESRR